MSSLSRKACYKCGAVGHFVSSLGLVEIMPRRLLTVRIAGRSLFFCGASLLQLQATWSRI
ncbi:hypothetical protein BDZ91DRAFT_713927 [Kalaharituber pfeilii]|nr:hypothetical protein BDZ91DRAFT_713927 [Kalaharituber pfeilii]